MHGGEILNKLRMIFGNIRNFASKKSALLIGLIGCQIAGVLVILVSVGMSYHLVGMKEDMISEQTYMEISWVKQYDNVGDVSNYHEPIIDGALKVGEVRDKFPKLIKGLESNIDMGIANVKEDKENLISSFHALNLENQNPEAYTESGGFGQYFTCEQIQRGSNVVTYEKQDGDGYKVEDNSISIAGKRFTIIKGGDFNEIIWKSVPDQMQVTRITIVFKEPMTNAKIVRLDNQIEELFPTNSKVVLPKVPNIMDMQYIYLVGAISLLLMIFAVLNLSLLIVFIYQKRQRSIRIMRICGASCRWVEQVFISELFVYELLGTVGAYAIFRLAVCPYMDKFYGGFSAIFSSSVYGLVFLCYYIVSFVIMKLRILKFRRQW